MITLNRIVSTDDSRLNCLIPLYEGSFPESEKRKIGQLKRMIENHTSMYSNAIERGGELDGMLVCWDMGDFYYLECLAVFPGMRNKKIGQQVLDHVAGHLEGLRLPGAEPTEDEMTTRRVNYYRRNEYKVLDRTYVQPSYHAMENVYPLWIMGNEDSPRLSEQMERIKEGVHRQQIGRGLISVSELSLALQRNRDRIGLGLNPCANLWGQRWVKRSPTAFPCF